EKDKLVAEVVRYILFKTHQNSGCPIKREELSQLVTKNYRHRSLPAYIINEAKAKLSTIFGYELRELQRSRPSSTSHSRLSQQSGVDAKSYVIISQLPAEVYKKYVEDVNTSHLTGFTFVAISIVQLAGGKIAEDFHTNYYSCADNLWHHLKRMGLHETDENHPVLGNVKQKDKVSGPEGTTLFYELAERALDGTVSERIKQYISQALLFHSDTFHVNLIWEGSMNTAANGAFPLH
ncbi:hypothetical protein Goarm_020149, partial [Gossypium armourianum]|nr:hypothetical protein [Gossypium armourianum]